MNLTIHEVARHRNGVCGEGFYAIRFYDLDQNREFVATIFGYVPAPHRDEDEPEYVSDPIYRDPHVAVLDTNLIGQTIEFGVNSWRGDRYADDLYRAIDDYTAEKDAEMDTDIEERRLINANRERLEALSA